MAVRIRTIEAIPVRIPLRAPMRLASETITAAENLIVRATDQEGVVGWGESASAPTMTGERLPGMVAAVNEHIAPRLIGQCIEEQAAWTAIIAELQGNPGARSAVDVAMHDLLGRRRGVSIAILLGASPDKSVPVVRTISTAGAVAEADRLHAAGASHFKVKVGITNLEVEAQVLSELRSVIGNECHLSADANMAWTFAEAARFLELSAGARLDYLEQALPDTDIDGMTRLARTSETLLCIDEALHSVGDIERYALAGAARGVGLKLLKLGGFLGASVAERAAQRFGWRTTWASKIAESSLGAAAVLHAACLSHDLAWGVSLTNDRLVEDLVECPVTPNGAVAHVPAGAGLGVEPNPHRIARFRIDC